MAERGWEAGSRRVQVPPWTRELPPPVLAEAEPRTVSQIGWGIRVDPGGIRDLFSRECFVVSPVYRTLSLENFEQVKLLLEAFGCSWGLASSSAGVQLGPGDRREGAGPRGSDAGEAPQLWGRRRAGRDERPTGQREVAASIRQVGGSGSPGREQSPHPPSAPPPREAGTFASDHSSAGPRELGRRGPGHCAHSSRGSNKA